MAGKRPNGDGTIYKKTVTKKDGKQYTYWETQVSAGYDEITGKLIRRTYTGKTQAEVKEKMQKATTEYREEGKILTPSNMTLEKWLDEWLKMTKPTIKYNAYKSYETQVRVHIKPALGKIKLSQLSKYQVQAFINLLSTTGKNIKNEHSIGNTTKSNEPLSPKTVKNIHGVLSKALKTAEDMELIRKNPATGIKLPRLEKKQVKPLTPDEIYAFRKAIQGNKYENVFCLTLYTGLRESEVLGLLWEDVDFQSGTLTVKGQLLRQKGEKGKPIFTIAETKNSKQRKLNLMPEAIQLLERVKIEQTKNRLSAGAKWEGWQNSKEMQKGFVFTNKNGGHLNQTTVYQYFKEAVKAIGVPESRFHDLRHTFATECLRRNVPLNEVQNYLGHSLPSTTLNIYAHSTSQGAKELVEKMKGFTEEPKQAEHTA